MGANEQAESEHVGLWYLRCSRVKREVQTWLATTCGAVDFGGVLVVSDLQGLRELDGGEPPRNQKLPPVPSLVPEYARYYNDRFRRSYGGTQMFQIIVVCLKASLNPRIRQ